jgi:CubicO group peptidase (beta-lactamase class C family)
VTTRVAGAVLCMVFAVAGCSPAAGSHPAAPGGAAPGLAGLPTHRIDAAFAPYDRPGSPGCAAGLVVGGRLAWARGYGLASLEQEVPIRPATVFDLGSTSKQITAAAIGLLARDGRLSLDDDVRAHIPELPDLGARITLRHLLTHTSGLRDYTDLLSFAGHREEDVTTEADALAVMARQRGVNFRPGAEFRYCNTGFFLASVIVERVSGKSLREFAAERLFRPLGMTHTTFMDDHAMVVPGRATGYAPREGGGFEVAMSDWEQTGDGAVQSSVEDMALWATGLDSGAVGGRALTDLLQTPGRLADGTPLDYGLGLFLDTHRGVRLVQHAGAWAGFRAMLMRAPERGLAVITLCNIASADTTALSLAVLDAALDAAPDPPPASPPAAPVDPAALAGCAGTYVSEHQGEVARVTAAGGALRLDGLGPDRDLVPEGTTRFRTAGGRLEVEFEAPGGRMLVRGAGYGPAPVVFDRLPAWTPSAAALRACAGSYANPEIGPAWTVAAAGDRLRLTVPSGESADLKPLAEDLFDTGWGVVRFLRDRRGEVTGLSFTDRGLIDARLPRSR